MVKRSNNRVAISGASGLIGTALSAHLTNEGYSVSRFVRRASMTQDEIQWDPKRDRKSTRLNSSHTDISRMPSSA